MPESLDPLKPTDPIRAGWLIKLADFFSRAANLRAEPPLDLQDGPAGRMLRLAAPRCFPAVVLNNNGAGSYTLREIVATPGGAWVPLSGAPALTAIERSATSDIQVGTFLENVRPGSGSDYRFTYIRGGGTGIISCRRLICFHVQWQDIPGADIFGAQVTIKDNNGNVVCSGTCTGDFKAPFCCYLPLGTYTFIGSTTVTTFCGSPPGSHPCSNQLVFTVNNRCTRQDVTLTLCCPYLVVSGQNCLAFGGTLDGMTGWSNNTLTTNVGSCAQPHIPMSCCVFSGTWPGTYTVTATYRRFDTCTNSITATCRDVYLNCQLVASAAYTCTQCYCTQPMARTLNLSDEHGTCTLTYGAGPPGFGSGDFWYGCYSYSEPNGAIQPLPGQVPFCCMRGPISATIAYVLTCQGGTRGPGSFRLTRYFGLANCQPPPICPSLDPMHTDHFFQVGNPNACSSPFTHYTQAQCHETAFPADCSPVNLTFTFPTLTTGDGIYVVGISDGFATVTE
jgi:hypothetical protein